MAPIGSTWSRWDLHVHTPASHVQEYGRDENAWRLFLDDLESLPTDFTAIGINDYLTVDGYRQVVEARDAGRLANISVVFPVVEFRLKRFAGTATPWKKVNFHVIFSNEIDVDLIEREFLSNLRSSYDLGDGNEWTGPPTRDRLEELGRMINTHRASTDGASDYEVGFNNFHLEPEELRRVLGGSNLFTGKYLLAVGKAEWDQLRWDGGGAGEKMTILNQVDFAFTACATEIEYAAAHKKLKDARVNSRLLHCSDAHAFSTSAYRNKIGESLTWIKAAPTFDGLVLARHEFDERVYVGAEPPQVRSVRTNPTRYIRAVTIRPVQPSTVQPGWFRGDRLLLNPGLVAIIGNKGSGKSALTDAIALVADADVESFFSFLNDQRFRNRKSPLAGRFECEVEWESGDRRVKSLGSPVDTSSPERVRYLPQNYFERLCADVTDDAYGDFERELKRVIFSWLPEDQRLGESTLDGLIARKTAERHERYRLHRNDLAALNREIAALERRLEPTAERETRNLLAEKERELDAHDALRPATPATPVAAENETDDPIRALDERLVTLAAEAGRLQALLLGHRDVDQSRQDLAVRLENIEHYVEQQLGSPAAHEAFTKVGLTREDVIRFEVFREALESKGGETAAAVLQTENDVTAVNAESEALQVQRATNVAELDGMERERQLTEDAYHEWVRVRATIVGDAETEGTLEYLKTQVASIPTRLAELAVLESRRRALVEAMFNDIVSLADSYRSLFGPVQKYLCDEEVLADDHLQIRLDASVRDDGVAAKMLRLADRTRKGSLFQVTEDDLHQRSMAAVDLSDRDAVVGAIESLVAMVRTCDKDGRPVGDVDAQLRKDAVREDLYDLVFGLEWLTPHFSLTFNDKQVGQLSPGERGSALLTFYLLVDQGDHPIVLDQPEENLDNETVARLLVPAIRAARRRRQVILVTHNPNLAVYCDADQVVLAQFTREPEPRIDYQSGPIEDVETRRWLITVLEGTGPAFLKRHAKYGVGEGGRLLLASDDPAA